MPRFALKPTIAGPLVRVYVGAPELYTTPKDPAFLGPALVDTGASISIISADVRSRIKPPEMTMTPLILQSHLRDHPNLRCHGR